jgi:hypothetical protein
MIFSQKCRSLANMLIFCFSNRAKIASGYVNYLFLQIHLAK